jgi:hypothetical protein
MNETSEIHNWLAERFPAEEPLCPARPTEKAGKPDGDTTKAAKLLNEEHTAVLRDILHRPSWSLADFRLLAAKAGLMPWACMATLNEWTLDNYADLLLEGDSTIIVNQNLINTIQL